jgi:two-component system, cell cycle response regulator
MNQATENIVPFLKRKDRPVTILTVEDDRFDQKLLDLQIRKFGHHTLHAKNGHEAIEILIRNPGDVDVVLMDRMMPVMDGLVAVRRMKNHPDLRKIPIVMVTAANNKKDIQDGLEAGVFYYLTKPVDEDVLRPVLLAAVREAEQARLLGDEIKKHRTSFNLIHTCKFEYRTLEEAECLAAFMALCFPEPERVLQGLAELLINAVEHGTLEIGYDLKGKLLESGSWRGEIERRQEITEYKNKIVEAVVTHKDGGVCAVITDQGTGFDWKNYMTIDPSRAGDNHGRGIAQAKAMCFDKLVYNKAGNQAVAFVGKEPPLDW